MFNCRGTKDSIPIACRLMWCFHHRCSVQGHKKNTSCIWWFNLSIRPFKFDSFTHSTRTTSIYHSLFHTVMTHGIIFRGNSSHSIQVFRMQKKAIRIIMGRGNRESCRNLLLLLLFYCDLSYTILNIWLYTIANITLCSYITIRMLPISIHPEINCSVLYLISCMIFVALFQYWQVPFTTPMDQINAK